MRIVSGSLRGRRFSPPTGFKARPTTDFAKESLFNILNNYFDYESIAVLDLFAGTGSISFEFASRGCNNIQAVENNPKHLDFIRKVIDKLGIETILPIRQDVFRFLRSTKQGWDIIFADPPYQMEEVNRIPSIIQEKKLLRNDGWLIVEHSRKVNLSKEPGYKETRHYGNVFFSFFTPSPEG